MRAVVIGGTGATGQQLIKQLLTNNKWDKINAYFPDLQGTTAAGILNAIDQENVLSAAYNRMIGAGKVGIESKINRQNQIQELFGKGWDAIKNEFGGSAQAADLSGIIPKNLEKTIEEGMQIRGVGEKKAERFLPEFVALIAEHLQTS